jgi:uncharacterized protein (DUF58 family)
MLTRNGIALVVLSGILLGAGWLLGAGDLYYPAAVGATLVVIAIGLVRLWPIGIEVTRTVEPNRLSAGETAAVHVEVRNVAAVATPVLELVDGVSGTDGARILLPRMAKRSHHRASYELPTQRRGRIEIGPVTISLTDPFGLARRTFDLGITAELTVYPQPVDTGPAPLIGSPDPRVHSASATPVSIGGEDFYTLRDYAPGDDLRRVHWPASAHSDDLVVRSDEVAWQSHCTILIDTRVDAMARAISPAPLPAAFLSKPNPQRLSRQILDRETAALKRAGVLLHNVQAGWLRQYRPGGHDRTSRLCP